jgi:hypothetical protein
MDIHIDGTKYKYEKTDNTSKYEFVGFDVTVCEWIDYQ